MRSDSQSRRDVIDLSAEICHAGAKAFQTIPGFTVHGRLDSGSAAPQNLPLWYFSTLK